tara:strand:+ start:633 stop:839 length:207 start_codon:yes stop_codon:yes gene_type:complete
MKIIKISTILFVLSIGGTNAFAETKQDCAAMKSDTGVKLVEKIKCKMENSDQNASFGEKIKNIFKKKN